MSIAIGDVFTQNRTNFRKGYRQQSIITVTVVEILTDYTDMWTGRRHASGVRFTMRNSLDDYESVHTLSLRDFTSTWVD